MTETLYLEDLQNSVKRLSDKLHHGCRDSGCCIQKPTGMATNGGCRCNPRQIKNELLDLALLAERIHGQSARWIRKEQNIEHD